VGGSQSALLPAITAREVHWLSVLPFRPEDDAEVCEINLRLCFPNLSPEEHRNYWYERHFESNGIGFIEIAIAWCGNLDKVSEAWPLSMALRTWSKQRQKNKGVLLIGPHLTTFEMAGFLYSSIGELNGTYRANDKNPLFDAFMYNGRHRVYPGLFERKDIRGAMRCLKKGGLLWYAPGSGLRCPTLGFRTLLW
jgi:KDO2-lipid IV(A) lauroyltransferase